jgi:hypothetical protein
MSAQVGEMASLGQTGWISLHIKSYQGKLTGYRETSKALRVLECSELEPEKVFTAALERVSQMTNLDCHSELTIDISVDAGKVSASITEGERCFWERDA